MDIFLDPERLREVLDGFGFWAPIVFAFLQLLQVVIAPIPGNVVTAVGGLLFGLWEAFFLSFAATIAGSMICFSIGRKLGRAAMRKFLKAERFDRYEALMTSDRAKARTGVALFLAMLLPFMPHDLLCFPAGVTDIKFRTFVVIVIVARPWGLLASAGFGAYGGRLPLWGIAALLVLCAAVGFFAMRNAERLEHFGIRLIHRIKRTKEG